MKKVILALMVVGVGLFADGYFVGADVGYGNSDVDVYLSTESSTENYIGSTDTKLLTLKTGYGTKDFRFFGYAELEDQKDNVVTSDDGYSTTIGAEFDVMIDNFYVGGLAGLGRKDITSGKENFIQYGVKVGYIVKLEKDMQVEVGIAYKIHEYDSSSDSGDGISAVYDKDLVLVSPYVAPTRHSVLDVKGETVSVFIGLNFSGL